MTLDLCQNFVSAQYLENTSTYFHQILFAFILTRSSLGLLHIDFRTFVPALLVPGPALWPVIYARSLFQLNILRTN